MASKQYVFEYELYIQPKFVNTIVSSLILLVGWEVNDEFTFAKNHQILPSIWSMSLVNKLQGEQIITKFGFIICRSK